MDYFKKFINDFQSSLEASPHLQKAIGEIESRPSLQMADSENWSHLVLNERGVTYVDPALGPLYIDVVGDTQNYRKSQHKGKQELISKALGLAKGDPEIWDMTFGLGQDSIFLAEIGAKVRGFERNPMIFLLMTDGLERAKGRFPLLKNLKLTFMDSVELLRQNQLELKNIGLNEWPDAMYLDPMFPQKKKSALPRKEMQIFRKLAGDDLDSLELLEFAFLKAKDRIVIKRPVKAPDLKPGKVHSYEGNTVRFDVYKPKN